MLEVPERAAAANLGNYRKVITWRRGRYGPLQGPGIPRIISRCRAANVRPNQIEEENQHSGGLEENPDGDDQIPNIPAASGFVGVDSAGHAQQPGDMHEVERQV